jgi:ABC-type nitrate/sulfonate/bicarbonate transport system permease component
MSDLAAPAAAPVAARATPAPRSRWARAKSLVLLLAIVIAWQLGSALFLDAASATLLPPPSAILRAFWELIRTGELWHHLRDSLKRELMAFAWAALAIPLGLAMGYSTAVHAQLDPLVEVLRPIPPLAWIPLSILWFGVGDTQNQFIIFLGMFFPILLNTIAGVRDIEPNLLRAARCLGASEMRLVRRIVLPAALPQALTGIRVGLGFGWMALVAAELIGANSGLGFLINDARTILRTDYVIVGMITIGLVGFAIDRCIRWCGRRVMPWSRTLGG